MTTWLATRALLALLITTMVAPVAALAQAQSEAPANPQTPPLKEVQVGAGAFTLAAPVPAWVDMVPIPTAASSVAVVGPIADTQYFIDDTTTTFIRRALTVNDPALLTMIGQVPITFVPQYQQL
jgi:hypothetical protein